MFRTALMSLALLVAGNVVFAQSADPTQPLLTVELRNRIDPRADAPRGPEEREADALTEADVLKLLPIAYRLAPTPADSGNDWLIVCAETTEFVVEFTDGKLSASSATFHPAANSSMLTPARFRELKHGMTKEEVERLFGEELHRAGNVATVNGAQKIERWRYVRGRVLEVYFAKGKVTGAHLKVHLDK